MYINYCKNACFFANRKKAIIRIKKTLIKLTFLSSNRYHRKIMINNE